MNGANELFRLALEHQRRGQLQRAMALYARILLLEPDNANAYNNLAVALSALGQHAEALMNYEYAIARSPANHALHFGHAGALSALGRYEEAAASYRRVIQLKPGYFMAHANLGNALRELRRDAEALLSYERGLACQPDVPELHYNRGALLAKLNRHDEALASYDRALALKPDYLEAGHNRGNTLLNLGRLEEAAAAYERAIALDPRHAPTQYAKALLRLRLGDYAEGLALHEWRLRGGAALTPREFTQARWRGETLAAGKTLLLHAEQGLGDSIQMLRYLPLVKTKAVQIVLELPKILHPVLGELAEGITVVESGGALPAFDLHCPLMSLPFALGTRLDNIPAQAPYLAAPPERLPMWNARLAKLAAPRVALAWSTSLNPYVQERSIAVERLAPLLSVAGFSFVSLQVEYRAHDLPLLAQLPIERIDGAIGDFGDTAAAIEQCDLVISVDTAVAHLAGALGKPLWLLLPFLADWRWLWNRNDSPWYPGARLFRQSRRGDWESVIAKVARELENRRHE